MSFFTYLFMLFVEPLKLLYELLFFVAYKGTGNVGVSIFVMSMAVNLLVLPLYNRADALQSEERDIQAKMAYYSKHIKKTFKGDERFMMLQEYYRINNYKPVYVLKSSVSLFLQIPFFIAAYSFLSELELLNGISLGPIKDLSVPDSLICIGSININLLPILMTVINIVSTFIYSDKGDVKGKIKLILMALVFLGLLYYSPSGLVFYWTLNNLFSLVKSIVVRLIKPSDRIRKASSVNIDSGITIVLLSCVLLAILIGLTIPSDAIVGNPTEYINTYSGTPYNPLFYLLSSAMISVGLFAFWIPLFIYLTKEKTLSFLLWMMPSMAIAGVINYMLFNKNFGVLSKKLMYEYTMQFTTWEVLINITVNVAVVAVVILLAKRFRKILKVLLLITLATISVLFVMRFIASFIIMSNSHYTYSNTAEEISIPMTTEGRNVVVIMMDRMVGAYIPYIFNESPSIQNQFEGFTYYPNTISYGNATNNGSPSLFGGYEYTPDNINGRDDVLLVDKQNEALQLMPIIFSEAGWNVTVGDAPYANYQWIFDTSIYDNIDNVTAYNISGPLNANSETIHELGLDYDIRLNRNLFCYGVTKSLPYLLQPLAYSDGNYNYMNFYTSESGSISYPGNSLHMQVGMSEDYLQEVIVLESLDDLIEIRSDDTDCFFMMCNETCHSPTLLEEPSYTPSVLVDNTEFDEANEDRFVVNGVQMRMNSRNCYAEYQSVMASCIRLGNWFDYLRENGIYDNTRIIIVADHGYPLGQFDDFILDECQFDVEAFNPVLLVKDFDSDEFEISYEFMTNADTPLIALGGIVDNPVNPFTGNSLLEYDKTDPQLVYYSAEWSTTTNNGTRFEDPNGIWLTVCGDIWIEDNWAYYGGPLQ